MMIHSATSQRLMEMYHLMLVHFGSQDWWPGETAMEIMVGAVLTQNTNWENVEKAIDRLKKEGLLTFEGLRRMPVDALAEKIRPAGYYNIKSKRLKNLLDFIQEHSGGDLEMLAQVDTERLRAGLISVKGVGPETADSILLYAFHRPVFVIDAYTWRILSRHGIMDEPVSYDELQAYFMDNLAHDPDLFNEFHALIVQTGKNYCRKKPRCRLCPLARWGPVSPHDLLSAKYQA